MTTRSKFSSSSGGDVGLNTNKISVMQNSLNQYMHSVMKNFKMEKDARIIQATIKGTNSEIEVRRYFKEIDRTCEEFLRRLREYNQKLTDMAASYKANDKFMR